MVENKNVLLILGGLFGVALLASKGYQYYIEQQMNETVTETNNKDSPSTSDASSQTNVKIQNGQLFSD